MLSFPLLFPSTFVFPTSEKVNRVGELKLALEERERAVALARSQLEAVRSKAAAERTAKEEKASFEAHRPTRWHELGDENRSRRTPPPRIVEPFELIPPREVIYILYTVELMTGVFLRCSTLSVSLVYMYILLFIYLF